MISFKLIIGTIICTAVFTACSKGDPPPTPPEPGPGAGIIVFGPSMSAGFSVQDTEGNDLLNPATPGRLNTYAGAMKTSYLDEHGDAILFYYPHFLPQVYGYSIVAGDEYYVLYMTMHGYKAYSADGASATSVNCIHWPGGITDTLECEYITGKNFCVLSKILVNGEILWEVNAAANKEPYFKIVIDGDQRTITSIVP